MGAILARISPPKFRPERDVPDLSGKIIIVTSGNTGIGYETVKQLLLKNAKVYLAARSPENAAAAIKRLEQETKKLVRKAAETFLFQDSRLDILFNNGGVMISPDLLTAQNHDLQFGTNVIGHFFLTELLVSSCAHTILSRDSAGHVFAPGNGIDFVSLKGGPERDAMLYGESKLGNILISNYFAKAYSDVLVSCSLHPGPINTELTRHAANWLQAIANPFFYPAPSVPIVDEYLIPWGKLAKADKRASNTKLEEEVVAYIKDQIKDF
ncbi:hypothetical protein B0H14DRAFT_3086657 [Mycena olivaceomarginata]|nr:hypothetical protein B0H14DRAFT_3086657 [Mycena olivaceomarginata]